MEKTYDVIVGGSGAGAFMAAIRAASLGASVVMLEKQATYGGTSARSGGGLWVPNNKNIASAGVTDSAEEGFEYMRKVIPEDQVTDKNALSPPCRLIYGLENTERKSPKALVLKGL